MKKFFLIIFLTACTSNDLNHNVLDLNMNVTFEEFKLLLIEYDKDKGFPNLDK